MLIPYVSLRKKLTFLLLSAILCTTLPLVYLSFNTITEDAKADYRNRVEDFFNLIKIVIENDKKSREIVEELSIKDRTSTLRVVGAAFTPLLEAMLQKDAHATDAHALLRNLEVSVEADYFLLRAEGNSFVSSMAEDTAEVGDLLFREQKNGLSLHSVLKQVYEQPSGVTSFMSVQHAPQDEMALVFAQRLGRTEYILLAISTLEEIYSIEETLAEKLYQNLRDNYNKLDILDNGFLVVYDAFDKTVEASVGKIPSEMQAFLARSHAPKKAEFVRTQGMGEFYVHTSKAIEERYYFVVGLSEYTISSLANSLQKEQLPVFICVLLLGALLGPLCARRALKSLENLTKMAKVLPQKDFTKDLPLENFHLPLDRRDEIGDLARSFANMSHLMHENVKNLVNATAQQSRLETELKAARLLQEDFLPQPLAACLGRPYSIAARLLPAREIGGDLYDYGLVDEDTVFFCIGDVSGKGMPSALLMGITIILARAAAKLQMAPHEAMAFINNQLCQGNGQQMFVSLFWGQYHIKENRVSFSLAGHPAPLLFGKKGASKVPIAQPNLVVGLIPDIAYAQHEVVLEEGESLLLYTDGISEAVNTQKEFYGEEKIAHLCNMLAQEKLIDGIFDAVHIFAEGTAQADDMTLLLFQRVK